MEIRYLQRDEVDDAKWDGLIARSPSETLYPYSWYLDASAENWSALVVGDYEFIMPLTWRKKLGMPYAYQPVFCLQLGVFSEEVADTPVVETFAGQVMRLYRLGVVQFNAANVLGEGKGMKLADRQNYVLPLGKDYESLHKAYSENNRRNLKKALQSGNVLDLEVSLEELMALKRSQDGDRKTEPEYQRMEGQFRSVLEYSRAEILGVRKREKLLTAAFMAFSRTRIIYLMSATTPEGKEDRAMFQIMDAVIRKHAGADYSLDFEGSSIPSIARFFGGFGAGPEIYQQFSFNRFPRWFIFGRKYGR